MAGRPRPPLAAVAFLAALYGDAAAGALIELRWREGPGMDRSFHRATAIAEVAAAAGQLAARTDVYVGVLPRRRRGGGRDDILPTGRALWVDCDSAAAVLALDRFEPPPSIVVASGTGDNRHAYWLLKSPVVIDAIEEANHRLAAALGADGGSAEPARILRPPTSLNHKHDPPAPVRLLTCDNSARYRLSDIVGALPPLATAGLRQVPRQRTAWTSSDPLLRIPPAVYVERLTGAEVPWHRKIRCPFHADDTPSLHVYREAHRGWYCYGCRHGGSVYDFAALLWGLSTRGNDFVQLRRNLTRQLAH